MAGPSPSARSALALPLSLLSLAAGLALPRLRVACLTATRIGWFALALLLLLLLLPALPSGLVSPAVGVALTWLSASAWIPILILVRRGFLWLLLGLLLFAALPFRSRSPSSSSPATIAGRLLVG